MTVHAHLKRRIRARMARTGERYSTARHQILAHLGRTTTPPHPLAPAHQPGLVPATTALGALLRQSGQPWSEAMLFGLAGGIGLGIFAFYYAREDQASFFLAGRHQWHDDTAYLTAALQRLGLTPILRETSSARTAAQQLDQLLDECGLCVAWVDLAGLPHRAMPASWSGSGYHVVTVYQVDPAAGTALIGDLTDEPISLPLADLAPARARIAKQRHRLLAVAPAGVTTAARSVISGPNGALPAPAGTASGLGAGGMPAPPSEPIGLAGLVRAGLTACHHQLLQPTLPVPANGRLTALQTWAERMEGGTDRQRWEIVFRPGANFWRGLSAIHEYIEHYGTGGGLCRPLFADFLHQAADALDHQPLARLADQYAGLGRAWSALAEAALPEDVPLLAETKRLQTERAALLHAGGPASELRAIWQRLAELERQAGDSFPLTLDDCRALRHRLREQIEALAAGEQAALAAIPAAIP